MVLFSILFIKRGKHGTCTMTQTRILYCRIVCALCVFMWMLEGRLVTCLCWICSCFTYGLSLPLRCPPVSQTATYSSVFTHNITTQTMPVSEEQTDTKSWIKHETVNTGLATYFLASSIYIGDFSPSEAPCVNIRENAPSLQPSSLWTLDWVSTSGHAGAVCLWMCVCVFVVCVCVCVVCVCVWLCVCVCVCVCCVCVCVCVCLWLFKNVLTVII